MMGKLFQPQRLAQHGSCTIEAGSGIEFSCLVKDQLECGFQILGLAPAEHLHARPGKPDVSQHPFKLYKVAVPEAHLEFKNAAGRILSGESAAQSI